MKTRPLESISWCTSESFRFPTLPLVCTANSTCGRSLVGPTSLAEDENDDEGAFESHKETALSITSLVAVWQVSRCAALQPRPYRTSLISSKRIECSPNGSARFTSRRSCLVIILVVLVVVLLLVVGLELKLPRLRLDEPNLRPNSFIVF